jgi:hypothetical protein
MCSGSSGWLGGDFVRGWVVLRKHRFKTRQNVLYKLIAIAITAWFYDSATALKLETKRRFDLQKNLYPLCGRNLRQDVEDVAPGFSGIWDAATQRGFRFSLPPRSEFFLDLSARK